MELTRGKQTDSAGIAKEKSRQQAVIKLGEQAAKQKENDPRMQKREPERWKKLTDREEAGAAVLEQIAGIGAAPVATAAAPAPTPAAKQVTRVMNKKTGKTQIYGGNPADIPKDRFNILK